MVLLGAALTALVEGGEVPKGAHVVDCGARVLTHLLDLYVQSSFDARKLEGELVLLVAALRESDDEAVRAFGVVNRQALWACLNLLARERRKRHGQEQTEAEAQAKVEEAG